MSVDNKREVDVRHMPTVRVEPTPYGTPLRVTVENIDKANSESWSIYIVMLFMLYALFQVVDAVDRLACVQDGKSLKQCKSEQENDDD